MMNGFHRNRDSRSCWCVCFSMCLLCRPAPPQQESIRLRWKGSKVLAIFITALKPKPTHLAHVPPPPLDRSQNMCHFCVEGCLEVTSILFSASLSSKSENGGSINNKRTRSNPTQPKPTMELKSPYYQKRQRRGDFVKNFQRLFRNKFDKQKNNQIVRLGVLDCEVPNRN